MSSEPNLFAPVIEGVLSCKVIACSEMVSFCKSKSIGITFGAEPLSEPFTATGTHSCTQPQPCHPAICLSDFCTTPLQDSELPIELTVIADCDAGTVAIERGGSLLGGTFVYDGLEKKDLRLAVGTYDDACRVTILSHSSSPGNST